MTDAVSLPRKLQSVQERALLWSSLSTVMVLGFGFGFEFGLKLGLALGLRLRLPVEIVYVVSQVKVRVTVRVWVRVSGGDRLRAQQGIIGASIRVCSDSG